MTRRHEKRWLSAAECAARTGLTVRALRVYEREGLLSPGRSEKGWRRYGPAELARLNTVTSLKALGLTLEQIRQVLAANPPPLTQILDMQIEAWSAKHAAAERTLRLLEVARSRAASRSLSLEELCELVRTLEASRSPGTQGPNAIFRRLLDEFLAADEERAWHAWWAEHPEDLTALVSTAGLVRTLFADIEQLARRDPDASSAAAQALIARHNEILARSGARERTLRLTQWNPSITAKLCAMWPTATLPHLGLAEASGPPLLSPQGLAFFATALELSAPAQACRELACDVNKLLRRHNDPTSPQADSARARLGVICQSHGLGDPYIYVQWLRCIAYLYPTDAGTSIDEAAWAFLARALESAEPSAGSELRGLNSWLDALTATDSPAYVMQGVPVVPLRDCVVYPRMVIALLAGRPKTVRAAEMALRGDRRVVLVTQREPQINDPTAGDLHVIGTKAHILDVITIPGGLKIRVKGMTRAQVDRVHEHEHLSADITVLTDTAGDDNGNLEMLRNAVITRLDEYARVNGWPPEHPLLPRPQTHVLTSVLARFSRLDAGRLADTIAAHAPLRLAQRQQVLELLDVRQRLEYIDGVTRKLEPAASGPGR